MRNTMAIMLFLTVAAAVQSDEAEPKGLTGSWRPVSIDGGKPRAEVQDETWVFDKNVLTIHRHKYGRVVVLTYSESPEASPSEFEWTRKANPKAPPPKAEPGIYKFEDRKLVLCYCSNGRPERPKAFESVASAGRDKPSFTVYILEPVRKVAAE